MTVAALLDVQTHDHALDRLRHRRDSLPEREELQRADARAAALGARRAEIVGRRDALAARVDALDAEATKLEGKAKEMEARLYSGEVTSPRELQAMQADVESLRRHRSTLEDDELELMEAREGVDAELAEVDAELAAVEGEQARLRDAIAAAETEIDAEIAVETDARAATAGPIAASLLATYERCRQQARGTGAARLVGDTCQGCHLSLPATEVERIRKLPPDVAAFCDNCGCILVAT